MTIIPRWIQYSVVAAAIAGLGVVLVMHEALSFDAGDLLRIRTPACSLTISVKGHSFPYLLEVEIKFRARRHVLLSLARGRVDSKWHYRYYAGGTVLAARRKIAPDRCGG